MKKVIKGLNPSVLIEVFRQYQEDRDKNRKPITLDVKTGKQVEDKKWVS